MRESNYNEQLALDFVLHFISIKELLHFAMNGFAAEENTRSQDNADICSKSIQAFLS